MSPGMTIVPDYGFADAPAPDIVVVGAQSGDAQLGPWLRKVHSQHALIMSVCTGAFRVAQAGLLDGKPATTHHSALQRLANQYPGISVRSSVRYVESDPLILTAGGLSSGIDSALHVVELYYGAEVAQATADYMEYQGQGWKTNRGAGEAPFSPRIRSAIRRCRWSSISRESGSSTGRPSTRRAKVWSVSRSMRCASITGASTSSSPRPTVRSNSPAP